jgi:hypothetical protein
VNARIDPQSRTYEVRVPLEVAGVPLKAGAFVRAEIDPRPLCDSLLVDREAILTRDGRNYVFRRRGDRAEQVAIEIGATGARLAEIDGGIEEGEQVVVGDVVERLADGAPIQVTGERPLPSGSSVSPPEGAGGAMDASGESVAPAAIAGAEG